MTRPIKFRAWDEVGKQWIYLNLTDLITNQLERQGFNTLRIINWCLFTGFHDKNSKEIFEGDIVEWLTDSEGGKSRMVASFDVDGGRIITSPYINSTSEIIGNIYQNGDLLK